MHHKISHKVTYLKDIDFTGLLMGNKNLHKFVKVLTVAKLKLKSLNLTDNELTSEGFSCLSDYIANNNKALEALNISNNELGDDAM